MKGLLYVEFRYYSNCIGQIYAHHLCAAMYHPSDDFELRLPEGRSFEQLPDSLKLGKLNALFP